MSAPTTDPAVYEPGPGSVATPSYAHDASTRRVTSRWRELTLNDIVAAAVAASMVAFLIPFGMGAWASRIVVLLVIAPSGLLFLARSARKHDPAALLLLAFILWIAISAMLSAAPGTALLGSYLRHTSLLVYLGAACMWSIGGRVSRRGQDAVAWAVVGSAAFSGLFAVIELVAPPAPSAFGLSDGRPPGLAIHPVFFGAFIAASGAWFAYRISRQATVPNLAGLAVAAALAGLSGSRVSLGAVFIFALLGAVRSCEKRAWWAVPAVVCGTFSASALHRVLGSSHSTIDRGATSGIGDRFTLWSYALRGWTDHPLLGSGPGRFGPAVAPYLANSWVSRYGTAWADAHNIVLEWLTTLGLVGLGVGACFVVVVSRRASGPLAWMAAAMAMGLLVEPGTAGTLGLAALLLGASSACWNDGQTRFSSGVDRER